jgi:flagellin-like hook-associated protein FlgL
VATINGTNVTLGGEFGTTARFLADGYDVEVDFTTNAVLGNAAADSTQVNARVDSGIAGLLGATGRSGDAVRYGIGAFTTENLGRGNGINSLTTRSTGGLGAASTTAAGNRVLGNDSVGNLSSGGPLSLKSARLTEAVQVIDRAVKQVVREQARLGTIQSNFIDSVSRAEVTQGNVNAADADILGVDAAAEITNLVQAQVGVSTATALSSQITQIQQTVLSLLRA